MNRLWSRGLLALLLLAQIVTHLFWLPISAHSGQVAIPWMLNQGMVLFGDVIEQHAPGSSLVGALAQRLLPIEPVLAIEIANLVLVLAVTVLVYVAANRLVPDEPLAGLMAAGVWFWWEPVYGNVLLYFDSLLGLALLLALVIWLVLEKRSGWLAPLLVGLVLGAATLAKQHAWAGIVLFALWLWVFRPHLRRSSLPLMIGAALVMPLLLVIVVAVQGNLQNYLYWNWGFNFSGLMINDPLSGDFLRKILFTNTLVPVFVLLGWRRPQWLLVGLLWLAGSATLVPRPGEIHAMGQLPLVAVMSGVTLAVLLADLRQRPVGDIAVRVMLGLGVILTVAWGWTGAAAYIRTTTGIPAHDEFRPITDALRSQRQPGDTLFILPETDSTPQIHPMSEMLPPGKWIKGWFWYLAVSGVVDNLLVEWQAQPPTFIVYFPDMIDEGAPGITPLVDFMNSHYTLVADFPDITFHGPAQLYRYGVGDS